MPRALGNMGAMVYHCTIMLRCRAITSIVAHKSGALIVPLRRAGGKPALSAAAKITERELNGLVGEVISRGDFGAKSGEVCVLHARKFKHERVVLAGLGDMGEGAAAEDDGLLAAFNAVKKIAKVTIALPDANDSLIMRAMHAAAAASYRFNNGGYFPQAPLTTDIDFVLAQARAKILPFARAAALGAMQARHLAEQPGNVCDPPFLAEAARAIARKHKLGVTVLSPEKMRDLKMNALLAVAQGSKNPAQLIILRHNGGGKKKPPIALVGKGVTFDTGGISLKPAGAMDEMKFDMSGAASVCGAMCAAAMMKLPLNIVGVIPACENMPGGAAVKPGDVVTAMNGKSIEILNTDAEGRLILADALAYTQKKYAPSTIIDIATLTGACVIALGHHISGMTSNNDKLASALMKAGDEIGDQCWRLPMGARYQAQLKTDYADIANIGGRAAGAITAACFLSRFVGGDCEWAHLDIAGTAWTTKKRGTGRPVPLLLNYLRRRGRQ